MFFRSANETMQCMVKNAAGVPYEDLTCLYPLLRSFYAKYVKNNNNNIIIIIINANVISFV